MIARTYSYDAFISYRHTERDKKIVDTIQNKAENYRSPCDGAFLRKGERIQRVFTDRSELPMTSDLGSDITNALIGSRFLIVIASPEYLQSRWCMQELRTFLQHNNNSTERILFIHADGHPSCITNILRAAGLNVDENSFHEPFYISAAAPTINGSVRIVKQEYLRLVAALIGCSYDSLAQRHKRARRTQILITAACALVVGAIVGGVIAFLAHQRQQQEDYRAMDTGIAAVYDLLQAEDHVDALTEMAALYDRYGQNKDYAAYLEEKLSPAAIRAAYIPAMSAFSSESLPFALSGLSVSSDGNYVIVHDIDATREKGEMVIILYDAFLSKLSEHVLPVAQWSKELTLGHAYDELTIDYLEDADTFVIRVHEDATKSTEEVLGFELTFSADGQLLSNRELTADELGCSTPKIRAIYGDLKSQSSVPLCMRSECVYIFTNKLDPITKQPTDDSWGLYGIDETKRVSLVAAMPRVSDSHSLDAVAITPDERFVLVKEARNIQNDVVTVCDTEGEWDPVRIDLGGHWIEGIQYAYQFDEKTQEARFVFNLYVSGESERCAIAECRIVSGKLVNCEMYECNTKYHCILSSQGLVYVTDDSHIKVLTTRNMCLPEQLAGFLPTASARMTAEDNDLLADSAPFPPTSTGDLQEVTVGEFTFTGDAARTHHFAPDESYGYDVGIGIYDSEGDPLLQFFPDYGGNAYFNGEDMVFGSVNYDDPSRSELFYFYDFYELMYLLSKIPS